MVLGWLAGRTFSERITITNNCGEDCDSSTASVGALLGILDPDSIDKKWLRPIGNALVLNDEIRGIVHPETIDGLTELVLSLGSRLEPHQPHSASPAFDASTHAIPVRVAHFNTMSEAWYGRDQSELPPVGGKLPELHYDEETLPGTWVRWPRTHFDDRLLMVRYQIDGRGRADVQLMFNCTEDNRVWLDGGFVHAAQATNLFFPAPHMAPVGQTVRLHLDEGIHELCVAIKRPPVHRPVAQWVIALTEIPSNLWIENAFRPHLRSVLTVPHVQTSETK